MSKPSKVIRGGRMTPALINSVVEEIAAYGRSERTEPLSWNALVRFSGFSRVSLWAKPLIREAFKDAREALRTDATPSVRSPRTTDERVFALQRTIEELRDTVRAYDAQWAIYEYNMHRLGYDADELRRPLDLINRSHVQAPRLKTVR